MSGQGSMSVIAWFPSKIARNSQLRESDPRQLYAVQRLEPAGVDWVNYCSMACKSCHSDNQRELPAEINIHFPGLEDLARRNVLVFPSILICLKCGFAEFRLPDAELAQLRNEKPPE